MTSDTEAQSHMDDTIKREVEEITVKAIETSDDRTLVEKVIFHDPEAPNERITFNPKIVRQETAEIDGIPTVQDYEALYEWEEFKEAYGHIFEAVKATEDGETVTLKADVTIWDQSNDDSVDGDETYAYINKNAGKSIEFVDKDSSEE